MKHGDPGDVTAQTNRIGSADHLPVNADEQGRYPVRYREAGEYDVQVRGQGLIKEKKKAVRVAKGDVTCGIDFDGRKGASLIITADTGGEDLPLGIGCGSGRGPERCLDRHASRSGSASPTASRPPAIAGLGRPERPRSTRTTERVSH